MSILAGMLILCVLIIAVLLAMHLPPVVGCLTGCSASPLTSAWVDGLTRDRKQARKPKRRQYAHKYF